MHAFLLCICRDCRRAREVLTTVVAFRVAACWIVVCMLTSCEHSLLNSRGSSHRRCCYCVLSLSVAGLLLSTPAWHAILVLVLGGINCICVWKYSDCIALIRVLCFVVFLKSSILTCNYCSASSNCHCRNSLSCSYCVFVNIALERWLIASLHVILFNGMIITWDFRYILVIVKRVIWLCYLTLGPF